MSGDHALNRAGGQAPQMAGERTPHARRARIDQHPVIDDGGKQLAEQQRDDIGRNAAQKCDGQPAAQEIEAPAEGAEMRDHLTNEFTRSRTHDQGHAQEQPDEVAAPEGGKEGLAAHLLGARDAAGTATAFADGVSISRDEAIASVSNPAERRHTSKPTDQESKREQSCQYGNRIPATIQLPGSGDDVEFTQAVVELEIGMDLGEGLRINGESNDLVLTVEQTKPGNKCLADFTLAVVDGDVMSGKGWSGRELPHGNLRCSPYYGFWRSRHERWERVDCVRNGLRVPEILTTAYG